MKDMWRQFRRLLLGTVVEVLLDEGVVVDFATLRIAFSDGSEFHVPRLDNYMRFVGKLEARLMSRPEPTTLRRLEHALQGTWPDLLEVLDIPIGDRLTPEKNRIEISVFEGDGGADILRVAFDLVAD